MFSKISIHAPRMGRDDARSAPVLRLLLFQSTRPVWGATASFDQYSQLLIISIHAPRMGRDCTSEGRDTVSRSFQSTRPVWGATLAPFQGGSLA